MKKKIEINEIVLLAGGFGTRLKNISRGMPKSLLPVYKKKNFLDILLERLTNKNFNKIFICVHYKKKLFLKYQNQKKVFIVEEKFPLGTGGAIKNCLKKIKNSHFLVLNSDTLSNLNIIDFVTFYKKKIPNKKILIGSSFVQNVSRFGKLIFKFNMVKDILEKKSNSSGWISNGHYILNKSVFSKTPKKFSVEGLLNQQASAGNVYGYKVYSDKFIDIGVPDDYKKIKNYFLDNNK